MSNLKTVGEVARQFQIPPRVISDLFYGCHLDNVRCPIMGNRRFIPADYMPELEEVLRERGLVEACEARLNHPSQKPYLVVLKPSWVLPEGVRGRAGPLWPVFRRYEQFFGSCCCFLLRSG